MPHKMNRDGNRRAISLFAIAMMLSSCGSQSSASDSANTATPAQGGAMNAVALTQAAQGAPAAAAQTALPIEQGLYISDYSGSCASADLAFFYDGSNYGYISQALSGDRMNSARPASAEINRIQRVGVPTRGSADHDANFSGFTRIWRAGAVGNEVQGVKATGTGRFIWREGSLSARQMEYDDTAYQTCGFAQLSSQMQAAVRQYRPQLASGPAPQASIAMQAATGGAPALPVSKGYYAANVSCAEATTDSTDLLIYLDEKRLASFDGSQRIQRVEALGGNRYRVSTRSADGHVFSDVYTVNGSGSFTIATSDGHRSNYTHCPTVQLPRAEREEWGDLAR